MNRAVMLDSGPLGRIAHPRPNPDVAEWFERILESGAVLIIPEIADYEVRRSFLLHDLKESVGRLDDLKEFLEYMPLNTEAMLMAAQLWADARKKARPTADPRELDGDVILAAQAQQAGAIVATENVGHLSLFVEAKNWRDIDFP